MSFPRYPKYKESGVEWLGEVPEHWEARPNKALMTLQKREVGSAWSDTELLSLTLRGVVLRDIDSGDGKYPADFSTYQMVEPQDLVFCLFDMDETPRTVGVSRHHGMITAAYDVFRCKEDAVPSFVYYFYMHIDAHKRLRPFYTGLRKTVRTPTFLSIKIPFPPNSEQQVIATFLDRETAKIDTLIAEQQRLIALLQEKRQAVISHAVTKGLNPDAPMKDSGIEWLGEVPEHWEVTPLKRLGSIRYGIGEPPAYHDEGTPLIRATNVRSGVLTSVGLVFVNPEEIPQKRIIWLNAGDIIVVRSGAGTGDSAIVPKDYGPAIAGFDMVLRLHGVNAWFIQFALLSKYVREGQVDVEKARAAQPHLNAEELGGCRVVLPPEDEQMAIVDHLFNRTQQFDLLIAQSGGATSLLQERRSALISAAVTGQIDVRGIAGSEAA